MNPQNSEDFKRLVQLSDKGRFASLVHLEGDHHLIHDLISELRAAREVVEAARIATTEEPWITRAEFNLEYRALTAALATYDRLIEPKNLPVLGEDPVK